MSSKGKSLRAKGVLELNPVKRTNMFRRAGCISLWLGTVDWFSWIRLNRLGQGESKCDNVNKFKHRLVNYGFSTICSRTLTFNPVARRSSNDLDWFQDIILECCTKWRRVSVTYRKNRLFNGIHLQIKQSHPWFEVGWFRIYSQWATEIQWLLHMLMMWQT